MVLVDCVGTYDLYFLSLLDIWIVQLVEIIFVEDKYPLILHGQYNFCSRLSNV